MRTARGGARATVALSVCVLLLVVLARSSAGTYEHARAVGKRCSTCHDSRRPDVTNLNAAGRYFMANRALPRAASQVSTGFAAKRSARPVTGEAIFARNCAVCHGPSGEGTPRGKALHGEAATARTETEIAAVVRDGVKGTPMFPFKRILSYEEIQDVARHVAALEKR